MAEKMENKKADVDWKFFLAVVVIIASFLVILFFYYMYNWKGEINKQTCHESVILKASMPEVLDRPVANLPLRCQTDKICITGKVFGGECSGFVGEKVSVARVSSNKEKQLEDIKGIIANSLYDCWSMMGEGKLNIFSREFQLVKGYNSRCVICARIDFDAELKEKLKEEYPEGIPGLSEYLDNTPVLNKNTNYSQFLTGFKGERPYGKELEGVKDTGPDLFGIEQQAVIFQEFDRTTAPEDVTGTVAGIAAGLLIGIPTKSIKVGILAGFGGAYLGRKGGSLIGGLMGESYIASWAFAPYRVSTEEIKTEYIKNVEKDGGECYARVENKVYGFDKNGRFMTGEKGLSEEVKFLESLTQEQKDFLNKIVEELTIKCYDLTSFQCDDFESYV